MNEEQKKHNDAVLAHMHRDNIFNAIVAMAAVGTFLTVLIRGMKSPVG